MKFLLLIFCLFSSALFAQDPAFPPAAILRQHHIRKLKVKEYYQSDPAKLHGKPDAVSHYRFDRAGRMTRSRQRNIKRWYSYDKQGRLIAISEKWSMFTNAWLEGYARQYTVFEYGGEYITVREYKGRYQAAKKDEKALSEVHIYRDTQGRDTLSVTVRNDWYYAAATDTGFTKNTFSETDSLTIVQATIHNYPRNKNTEINVSKTDQEGKVIETGRDNQKCQRRTFEYKKDLLKMVIHYNCLGGVYSCDVYHYR